MVLLSWCMHASLCFSNLIEKVKGLFSDKLSFIAFLLYLCWLFLSMSLKLIPLLPNMRLGGMCPCSGLLVVVQQPC